MEGLFLHPPRRGLDTRGTDVGVRTCVRRTYPTKTEVYITTLCNLKREPTVRLKAREGKKRSSRRYYLAELNSTGFPPWH